MNKREFEKYFLSNLDSISSVHCNIVEGFDLDNNDCCWLDVYIEGDENATVFCSDDYPLGSKDIEILQRKWSKKLETWLNPNWGISLIVETVSI